MIGTATLKLPSAATATCAPCTVTETLSAGSAGVAAPLTCTLAALVRKPSCGAPSVSAGGVALARTWRCWVVAFPAASAARRTIAFAPGVSATVAAKLPSCASATCAPLTVATTGEVSDALPSTATESAPIFAPSAGASAANTGGMVSSVTATVRVAWLPARSSAAMTSALAPSSSATVPCSDPSCARVSGAPFAVTDTTPATSTMTTATEARGSAV